MLLKPKKGVIYKVHLPSEKGYTRYTKDLWDGTIVRVTTVPGGVNNHYICAVLDTSRCKFKEDNRGDTLYLYEECFQPWGDNPLNKTIKQKEIIL